MIRLSNCLLPFQDLHESHHQKLVVPNVLQLVGKVSMPQVADSRASFASALYWASHVDCALACYGILYPAVR